MLLEGVFSLKPGDRIVARKKSGVILQIDTAAIEFKVKIGDTATVQKLGIDERLNPYVDIMLDRAPTKVIRNRPKLLSACFVRENDLVDQTAAPFRPTATCPSCHNGTAVYKRNGWECDRGCDLDEHRYCKCCGVLFSGFSGKWCSDLCKDSARSRRDG